MKDRATRRKEYKARRNKVLLMKVGLIVLAAVIVAFIAFIASAFNSGYKLNPTSAVVVHYSGFEGSGSVETDISLEKMYEELDAAYVKYASSIWPIRKTLTQQDFEALGATFDCSTDTSKTLKNGDELTIDITYDKDLAKKLDIEVMFESIPLVVDGLDDGIVVTKDDLFANISISMNGVSPLITAEIINENTNDFFKTIEYTISPKKDYYENGDTITVTASYDNDKAIELNYNMDTGDNKKEFKVDGFKKYVSSVSEIDEETFKEAVEAGKECFVNANEYGLRIFTEAGIRYTWVGTGNYTFKWSNPRLISAYVQTISDTSLISSGKTYNNLELVYNIHISQANGAGCDAEAVVCFNDMTIDENGKVDINKESGQLFSASYVDAKIKSSLKGWFGDDYNLEKFDLTTMDLGEQEN